MAYSQSEATLEANHLFHSGRSSQSIELNGPWAFYAGKLLDHRAEFGPPDLILPYIQQWTSLKDPKGLVYSRSGVATYRMTLKNLPFAPDGYSLIFRNFDSAMRLYIYGRGDQRVLAMVESGKVGEQSEEPSFEPKFVQIFPSREQDLDLIVQISNHTLPYGGMWMPPSIGKGYAAYYPVILQSFFALLSAGVVICALINNLMLWWRDRKEFAALAIAFCSLACFCRICGTDMIGIIAFKEYPILIKRFEYGSIPAMSFFALYSILTFDSYAWQRRIVKILCVSAIPSVLLCAFASPYVFARALPVFQVQVLASIFVSMLIAFQSIRTKREGYRINVFGFTLAFFLVFWDVVLVAQYKLVSLWLSPMAGALYVLFQSEILAQRAAQAKKRAQELAVQNAEHQEQLRLETETRFQLASDLAHHLNNPLNHIVYSSIGIKTALTNLRNYISAVLGEEVSSDPEAMEFQRSLEGLYQEFEPHFQYLSTAVERGAVAIKEIRYLSGVDGYALETYSVLKLKDALIKRLSERFPRFESELVQCRIEDNCSGNIQGNFYVFLHVIELFCQTFLIREKSIRTLYLLQTKSGQLQLKYQGDQLVSLEVREALEKKLNFILKPFLHEVNLSKDSDACELLYRPLMSH